jgi:hypothetical protein
LVGLQASLGLFISDDLFYAVPYNSVVSDSTAWGWHHRIFTLMQIALVLIVLATVAVTALIYFAPAPVLDELY